MWPFVLTLVAAALALTPAAAATCSPSQDTDASGLFKAAAARAGCAPYATVGADNSVTIKWTCATTSCTPTMMQLALQLPDCETGSDGVNRKKQLQDQLYTKCQLCTPDQQDQIAGLWKSAAQTSACSKYATGGGTWFSWPCSATSCTATLKDLASKVPSCIIGTQNERDRIINGISTCTGTTVSTRTPSPGSSSSTGVSTTSPSTTKTPIGSTPETTSAPQAQPSSGTSSSASDAEAPAPAPMSTAVDGSVMCTPAQYDQITALWKSAAQTSACSPYATGGGTWFSWPCSATSCTATLKDLAAKVPSCAIGTQNERTRIINGISSCTGKTATPPTTSPKSSASVTTSTMWAFSTLMTIALVV